MSKREDKLLLFDIIESCNKIVKYVDKLSYDEFMCDEKTKDAVIRNFEIIGEASNRISLELKNENNHIKWRRLAGFRNRIVHEYFGIDFQIVWQIITKDLNPLIFEINNLLENK